MKTCKVIKIAGAIFLLTTLVAVALITAPNTPAQTQGPIADIESNGIYITKTVNTNLIIPGQSITFTIHYQIGSTPVTTVTITDTLPISTTWQYDTAPALGFTRLQTTTHTVWSTPTLGTGSASFQLALDVPDGISATMLTNTIRMSVFSGTTPISSTFILTTPVGQTSLYLPLITENYPQIELPPAVTIGAHPKSLVISEEHNRVYVTLFDDDGSGNPGGDGALAVIDLNTHQLLTKTSSGGIHPMGIGVLSDTLYIVNNGSNTISVMDAISLTLQQTITVGNSPYGLAITSDRVYVTNFDDDSISIINPISNTVITSVTVGHQPTFPAASGDCVYVPNHGAGAESVTIVCDDGNEIYRLKKEWGYFAAAYYPNPNALWNPLIILTRRDGSPGLYEISTGPPYSAEKPVPMKNMSSTPPFGIAYNPVTNHLLVVAADNDELHIVYPGGYTTGTVWPLPSQHEGAERLGGQGIDSAGHWAWVANYAAGSVSILYDP